MLNHIRSSSIGIHCKNNRNRTHMKTILIVLFLYAGFICGGLLIAGDDEKEPRSGGCTIAMIVVTAIALFVLIELLG